MSTRYVEKTHDARFLADRLIQLGIDRGKPYDPLQIIKLVYLSHGWMLGLYGLPLSAQPVEAWQYGPVIPDVYQMVKPHGRQPIGRLVWNMLGGNLDDREADLIKQVSDEYGKLSGIDLSQLTHAKNTPWHAVWNEHGRNSIIPNGLIKEHFEQLAGDD